MYKASLVTSPYYYKNRIFNIEDPIVNRDNHLYVYWLLKKELQNRGIVIATSDIHKPQDSHVVIYMDIPKHLPKKNEFNKSILIINEVAVVKPANWQIKNHKYFSKIFTFCDDIIDNKKYFKLNSCRSFNKTVPINISKKTKFCTMISGNKSSKHPLELYSKRLEAVNWFASQHPDDFDFYGLGWDKKNFTGISRPLNRIPFARKFFAEKYPTWKGPIHNKYETLSKYKFSISFENARGINGYVTGDKIFDPMEAGCIPIYWGAPNIEKYVPKNCFISMEDFKNWGDLYFYIKNMPQLEYLNYLDNIKYYIENVARTGPYSEHGFLKAILPIIENIILISNAAGLK